jgi:sigma-B regulation protein RsbU (phosphoserine phosphatase)
VNLLLFILLILALYTVILWQRSQKALRESFAQTQRIQQLVAERRTILDLLHQIGATLHSDSPDTPHLAHTILQHLCHATCAQSAAIYLFDEHSKHLRLLALHGAFPPPMPIDSGTAEILSKRPEHIKAYLEQHPIPLDSKNPLPLARAALEWKSHFWPAIPDKHKLPQSPPPPLRYDSAIILTLEYYNKRLGLLVLANRIDSKPFTLYDYDLAQTIAEQTSFAIEQHQILSLLNAKAKMDRDVNTAKEIQQLLLPQQSPSLSGYTVFARNIPAQEMSGDYFDYFLLSPTRLGLAIADVSGKGISTSLLMATCRSALRSCAPLYESAKETLMHLNRLLHPDIKNGMFITLIYAILDTTTHTLEVARAGHEIPFHLSPSAITPIEACRGLALGIDAGETFNALLTTAKLTLAPGDSFIAFTDGLNEAFDPDEEQFGIPRLKQALISHAMDSPEKLCSHVLHAVKNHVAIGSYHDDITLLVLRRNA